MTSKDKIKKEIAECLNDCEAILSYLQESSKKVKDKDFSFHLEYQKWYSTALKIVEYFGKDRLQEFKSFYEKDPKRKSLGFGTYVIQDFIKNLALPNFDSTNKTLQNTYNQYTILVSINNRIDNVLSDIQTTLFTELQDLELDTAKSLIKVNLRASGVIAGVILETYLKKVVENHKIKILKKSPTLSDLNSALKDEGIYDTTKWKKILYLSDIRNLCAHQKDQEPNKAQIEELIEGVHWVTKIVS